MWSFEHSEETAAPPAAVWRFYRDVSSWPTWNGSVERVELEGGFAAGASGMLAPKGQGSLPFRVVELVENEHYVSETEIAETVSLRISCTLTPLPTGRTNVTHRAELVGPAAGFFGQAFGPMLTAGIPPAVRALVALAEA